MIVADSSYIVEGLLNKVELIKEHDQIVTSELAIFEVANALWKRERIFKDLDDGLPYLSIFYGWLETSKILLVGSGHGLLQDSLLIARRNAVSPYDAVFVALALRTGLRLMTFDQKQSAVMRKESRR